MKKLLFLFALSASLLSCSPDNDGGGGSQMKSYTVEYKSFYDGQTAPYAHGKIRYNLADGKYSTLSTLDAGTGQVQQTLQTHFYTGGRLTKIATGFTTEDFIYDAAGNLVATEFSDDTGTHVHWRFVTLSPTISYAEKLTEAYDVPWAMIERRIIMEFDAHDNVIAAGDDTDIDGVREQTNHFFYQDNNLTGFENYNGESLQYSYSNVINNIAEINDRTYGKKVARLIAAEQYSGINGFPTDLHSVNVEQSMITYFDYEVLPSRYYRRFAYESVFPGGRQETTTEFNFR